MDYKIVLVSCPCGGSHFGGEFADGETFFLLPEEVKAEGLEERPCKPRR